MAQTEKRENSVLFALRDLRQIEENRVQEEELAVRNAEEAKRRAMEDAERRRREEEEARVRAEREHNERIENARVDAEREARMRVEAAEAAERNRIQGELDQQRMHHEMELRRAEVAKKRPTWMLVVTGFAVVAAALLIWFAIQKAGETSAAEDKKAAAEKEAQVAKEKADKAAKEVAELQDKFFEISKAMDDAQKVLDGKNDAASRAEAQAKLDKLRAERADMERRIAEAKAAAAHRERVKTVNDTCNGAICR
jgi:hypothetical protein